ncbi:uncharacterized protein M421DRAFT_423230 [Didymella exigua CBS 183.55]|uniref:Uncharacterized protein n=1 Tax=Didymella exigua CBS 183.55 TaxID=1150837 RepID=A0A6A5RET7_9PLEO|nr:uncharacterized protein M421DRAFT_423230 [Didymella exigua CBS 183.55]KAF1925949.1 hypothetical protein M421DRAFT_423230 [Didymella exigua CBS 183.55]
MRYSSALVLSTLAVGQAAAANHHNRHASFHSRRQADAKRSAANDVNWKAVAYDLNDVDWDKVNWSSVFNSPTPTPTPTAQATYTVASVDQDTSTATPTSSTPAVKVQEIKTSATPSSSTATATSSAPAATSSAPAATTSSSSSSDLGDVVSDLLEGVASIVKSLGIVSTGKNDKSSNGGIWIGDDSAWKAEFTNDANEDAVIFCWKANGFSGMSLNVNQPEISVGLKSGEKTVVSFAANVPAACAPAFSSTKLANFGGLDQTWWEVTFGQSGAFDVSRNVNMKGRTISSKGSKCVSDMNTCVFKCKEKNGVTPDSCESGTDYDLFECGASSGGGGGYDTVMAGTGGGCAMGSSSETVKVSFS